ncbi:MAG: AAA family ATPase, partial [Candidatus Aenigmatarchaeota archaeon]
MNNKLIAKFSNELEIGIVKLNPSTMKLLNLENSDYCEILGKKAYYSMVFADKFVKDNEIYLDLVGIKNLGVKENDSIIINPIKKLPVCKRATLIPLENKGYDKYKLHLSLRGVAISKGMYVGIINQEKSLDYFYISEIIPENACIINDTTNLIIKSRLKNNFEGVLYEDIGGLKKELKTIRDIIELQLLRPDIFKKLGVKPIKGILLHGPPGTGKTLIAKAVATETNAYFIGINAPELLSKYVGESEENLKNIFKLARENSPSIIFIDEIDAIAQKREDSSDVERRLVAELLTLMDGIESNQGIVVIGATNRIDSIDEALRRPGRFDKEIEIPIPDENSRIEILEIHTRNMPLHKDVDIIELAKICYGFTGADMEALCKEAAMNALNRIIQNSNDYSLTSNISIEVTMDDFIKALNLIEPSALREITSELPYATWNDFG